MAVMCKMFSYDLKYQSKQDFCYICKIYLYSTEGTNNTLFYLYHMFNTLKFNQHGLPQSHVT